MRNSKKHFFKIISLLLITLYLLAIYVLWSRFKLGFFELKDVITIQIQLTALLIGLIAATVGLFNFLRKSGVKLQVSIEYHEGEFFVSIRNLKDKEITIFDLYIYIPIMTEEYAIDILKSADPVKDSISIKPYGRKNIYLEIPIAIKILRANQYVGSFKFFNPEYLHVSNIKNTWINNYTDIYNVVLCNLRHEKRLQYLADTPEGDYKGNTLPSKLKLQQNKLIFCNKEKLTADYHFYNSMINRSKGDDDGLIDLQNISDDDLQKYLEKYKTIDEIFKSSTENNSKPWII